MCSLFTFVTPQEKHPAFASNATIPIIYQQLRHKPIAAPANCNKKRPDIGSKVGLH